MSQPTPTRSRPAAAPTGRGGGGVTSVLAFAGVIVSVTQTLMVPLLASLPSLLHTSISNAAWVITVTLLAGAVATPVLGRLGDMFGKRKMLLLTLLLLVVGSLVCGFSSSLLPMLIGRALQGCSIGAIPLGISIMRDELPPARLGVAMGLMSSSLGIGAALGLPAAAVVAEHFDWHVLFFGSAGLAAIGLVLIVLVVPESAVRSPGRFDLRGAIALSAGLVFLLVAISKGSDWGWSSGSTLGSFAAAVVILVGWGWLELRTTEPLVDLRSSARPQVLLTNVASVLVGFALYCTQLVPPQLLQLPTATGYGLGQSMLAAGLCVTPVGLLMMAASPVSARLTRSRGPKTTLIVGIVVLGVAYVAGLALLNAPWQLALFSAIAGAGVGLAYAAMPTLIINAVPASETAAANGLNSLMRSIGTSSSSAVVGMVLSGMTTRIGTITIPSLAGFRTSLLVACGACAVALVVAVFIPGRRRTQTVSPVRASIPAPGSTIRGLVRNVGGAAVEGATFNVIDQAGRQVAHAVGRADGSYAIDVANAGHFVLICSARGYQPQATAVALAGAPIELDLELSGTGGISGTVFGANGTAVAGALVVAIDARGEVANSVTAGAGGAFDLVDLRPGHYTLAVSAEGHRLEALSVEVADGARVQQDIELSRGGTVRVTVHAPDGSPLADARVVLVDRAGNPVATGTTNAFGDCRFTDVADGEYTLIASGYAAVSRTVSLHNSDQHDCDLTFDQDTALN